MRLMPGMSGAAGAYDSIYCIYEILMRLTLSRSSAPKHVKLRDTWQKQYPTICIVTVQKISDFYPGRHI